MRVEFVSPEHQNLQSGIGRYVHSIIRHLSNSIEVSIRRPKYLPYARYFTSLQNLPIGIIGHVPGSIIHFPQIMGCSMMLYRPYHPSVATVHDLGFLALPEEWGMFDLLSRQLLRLSIAGLRKVDLLIADSDFTRQGIIKHLGISKDRVVTIHLGIDHNLFKPLPDSREILIRRYSILKAWASFPWVLNVGSELPRKNIGMLLNAVSHARKEIPEIRLIKIGVAGNLEFRRETLRIIEKLDLEKHVLIFDEIPEDDLPLFYNAADVFATASKLEGFGFPVLESMACGTPVVCSYAGSLPEICGAAALHFRIDDFETMSRQIIQTLTKKDFRDSRREVCIRQSSNFKWEKSATTLVNQYKSIARKFYLHA